MITKHQNGFTAVELLITLFIAAVFLFAGYQLYTQVIRDAADADKTARISNIAYERLRKAAGTVSAAYSDGCESASEGTTIETPAVTGFSSVTLTIVVDCPYSTTPGSETDVFLVSVSASYTVGSSTKVLKHAIYTN